MRVKEQVKDFVHGVKRKLSQKHRHETSVSDSLDYSSMETVSEDDSSSSFSMSTQSSSQERGRFLKFIRRTASTCSNKGSLFQRGKRSDGKRNRLVSAPAMSSERVVGHNYKQPASYHGATGSSRRMAMGRTDYSDVINVCAGSTISVTTVTTKGSSLRTIDQETTSQSHPPYERGSSSDTSGSGTLVTGASDVLKSVSESDTRPDKYSDKITESPRVPTMTDQIEVCPDPTPAPAPAPAVIPRLTAPSMFLPTPNTDPLSALLTKYVPAEQRPRRYVVGEYAGRDVHEMVMSNSWRALAKMARDRIVASDPEDLPRILDLWSLRLSSLARLRLTNQASAECTNLFAVLNAVQATSAPGTFPGSGSLSPSPLPSSSLPVAPSPLSPSGLSTLVQLPGLPSEKSSSFSPSSAATPAQGTSELSYPFELTVFHARVHYWSGDTLGYVDALSRILAKCKEKAREEGRMVAQRKEAVNARGGSDVESTPQSEQASTDGDDEDEDESGDDGENEEHESPESPEAQGEEKEEPDEALVAAEANVSMWLERAARVCLILASQLIEMNDYQATINLLSPLCTYRAGPDFLPTPSLALHSALARVHLLSGNLPKAEQHFSIANTAAATSPNGTNAVAMNTALLAAASGDWVRAEEILSEMASKDPDNFSAINNLAVARMCQGNIDGGIDLLETAIRASPSSVVVAEPFLFNLSTMYELRSTAAIDKKRELLVEVAKWSGDGLKTSCLKMPSN